MRACIASAVAAVLLAAIAQAAPEPQTFRPEWRVGDQWVVEMTVTDPQARDTKDAPPRPVRWQFEVLKPEKLGLVECHKVRVRTVEDPEAQPTAILWVDPKTMTLRQFQSQLPVPGGFRTVTESYAVADGQAAPVVGPLSALPIDLPLLTPGAAKGQTFSYEANSSPAGKKAVGEVGFLVDVEQKVEAADPKAVQDLLPADFRKDVEAKPLLEVRLKSPDREVRQLWQAQQPWPVYAKSGTTTARLVKFTPAPRN